MTISAVNLWRVLTSPIPTLFVELSQDKLQHSFERAMSAAATPEQISAKLTELLNDQPRNWVAIEAVRSVALDRDIELNPTLKTDIKAAEEKDFGIIKLSGNCLKCAWDATQCELSAVMLCQVPIVLTPVGDFAGVFKGGWAYQNGQDVDEVDVILSLVGLTAVAAAIPSGGSSLTIKAGVGTAKLMNSMGALPFSVQRQFVRAFKEGVDWGGISNVRGLDDLYSLIRPKILNETVATVSDIGKVSTNLGITDTIYVMRQVENAEEIRSVSKASDVLGSKTTGTFEILGKNRFIRATMKWSDEVVAIVFGIVAAIAAVLGLVSSVLSSAFLRSLRRRTRLLI